MDRLKLLSLFNEMLQDNKNDIGRYLNKTIEINFIIVGVCGMLVNIGYECIFYV